MKTITSDNIEFIGKDKEIRLTGGGKMTATWLYSCWKKWAYENPQYEPAFENEGNRPTIPRQNSPAYFYLVNDWVLILKDGQYIIEGNIHSKKTPFYKQENASCQIIGSDVPSFEKNDSQSSPNFGINLGPLSIGNINCDWLKRIINSIFHARKR